jgi:Predicted integral membrane protein
MKIKCDVVKDLMPLYIDDVCTAESKKLLEEHIAECTECNNELKKMKDELPDSNNMKYATEIDVFKKIKKRNRLQILFCLAIPALLFCSLWFLVNYEPKNINEILSDKINEYNAYDNNYTIEKAERTGFLVEESSLMFATDKILGFCEHVWQNKNVEVSIAKETNNGLLLSYIINFDKVIYVLDYNVRDRMYRISKYKYLTYEYNTENGIQTRYLTNDKELVGKYKLTDEQKKNCYYLWSYKRQN